MELRINIEPVVSNSTGFDFIGRPLNINSVHRCFSDTAHSRISSSAHGAKFFLEAQKIRGTTETTTVLSSRGVGTKTKTTKIPTRWVYKIYRVEKALVDLLKSNGKKIVQKKVNHTYFYDIVDCKRG